MHRTVCKVELTVCETQRVRGSIGDLKCCSAMLRRSRRSGLASLGLLFSLFHFLSLVFLPIFYQHVFTPRSACFGR